MFTTIDKAITALVMGGLSILNLFHVFTISDQTATIVGTVIGALTPVLVYLIPNKS